MPLDEDNVKEMLEEFVTSEYGERYTSHAPPRRSATSSAGSTPPLPPPPQPPPHSPLPTHQSPLPTHHSRLPIHNSPLPSMFGCHEKPESVGITGEIGFVDLDGPEVTLSLEGQFWHRRETVLGRAAQWLNACMPEITAVNVVS